MKRKGAIVGRKRTPEYLKKLADESEEIARKYEWYGRFSWGYRGLFGGPIITVFGLYILWQLIFS
jgi:hypothetical protein